MLSVGSYHIVSSQERAVAVTKLPVSARARGFDMSDGFRRSRHPLRAAIALALCLIANAFAGPASADPWPVRAVKIIVPFPAGGTADAVPRLVADWLSRKWGQPVGIAHRTGAAGNIGAEAVYRAAPDGYTLLSSPPPPLVINQSLYPKLAFDPAKFEPIIVMAQVPNALIVNS